MREFAIALPHFTQLQHLDLTENDLQDEGAKILATVLKAPFVLSIHGASVQTSLAQVRLFCVVQYHLSSSQREM